MTQEKSHHTKRKKISKKQEEPVIVEQTGRGYLSHGENRVQWIFEGEEWPSTLKQEIIASLKSYILAYRARGYGDMVNYFVFDSYAGILLSGECMYYFTRRNRRYSLGAEGEAAFLEKLQEDIHKEQQDWERWKA